MKVAKASLNDNPVNPPVPLIKRGNRGNLGIIFIVSAKNYVLTPKQNHLTQTVLMRGHTFSLRNKKKKRKLCLDYLHNSSLSRASPSFFNKGRLLLLLFLSFCPFNHMNDLPCENAVPYDCE